MKDATAIMAATDAESTCIHVGVDVHAIAGSTDVHVPRAMHEILSAKIDRDPDDYGQHSEEDAAVFDGVATSDEESEGDGVQDGDGPVQPDSPRLNPHGCRRTGPRKRYGVE